MYIQYIATVLLRLSEWYTLIDDRSFILQCISANCQLQMYTIEVYIERHVLIAVSGFVIS
jgi:hypothetical protein